jgi:hypothetical protein
MTVVDLTRARSFRELVLATVQLYRRYPLLFLALALMVAAPYQLAVLAITGHGPLKYAGETRATRWVLFALSVSVVSPLISALHCHAVVAIGEGRQPRFRQVTWLGLKVLPLVGAADLAATAATYAGFALLILPGILISLMLAVVPQAAALEQNGLLDTLRRSARLTDGHYLHVLTLLIPLYLIAIASEIGARQIPLGSSTGVLSVTVGIAVYTLIASVTALALALLYFDLRARADDPEEPRRPTLGDRLENVNASR